MKLAGLQLSGRRGFTLIELMVVMIIISIMSAVVVGEMRGTFQDALLRSTSRDLIGACNVASSRAVALNRPHRLRIDKNAHRFVLERSVRGGQDFVPVKDVPGSDGPLDARISINIRERRLDRPGGAEDSQEPEFDDAVSASESTGPPRAEAISFYADGTADERQIELRDADGFRLALRVNPITARVEIVEGEPK